MIPCQTRVETLSRFTERRLSGQEFYVFRPTLSSLVTNVGGCFTTFGFDFVQGTVRGATLQVIGNTDVFYPNFTNHVLDTDDFSVYQPEKVQITTFNGRKFDFDMIDGVTRLEDRNGDFLSISSGGIVHSSNEA